MVTARNDLKGVWHHAKAIRSAIEIKASLNQWVLAPLERIDANFRNLSNVLNLTSESDEIFDLSEEEIDNAAEVFLYLNSIPQTDQKSLRCRNANRQQ